MSENKFSFYKKIKFYWPWLILGLALFLTHSQHLVDSDEGIILNAAWNIINGKKLYLDSFEFIAPGSPYLLALWWKLTGVGYLTAACLSYLVSFSSLVGLYLISQKLGVKQWKFLAPAVFIILSSFWTLINHNNFNAAAIIWSAYFLILGLDHKKYFLLLAGFFSSLAILFTQHKGLVSAIIFLIYLSYLTIKQKANLAKLIIFIIGLVIPLSCLFIFWSPMTLYQDLIIFPSLNYPLTNFLPLTWWLICFLSAGVIVFSTCLGTNKKIRPNIILLSCLSLSLLLTSLTRADIEHIFQTLVILLPVLALMFEIYLPGLTNKPAIYTLLTLLIISRCLWPPFDNLGARNIIKVIKESCPTNRTIYAGPFMPGIYFEMRSLNIIPYSFLITQQQTKAQFAEALAIIKKNPPTCVVLSYGVVEKFSYNKNNPLDNFFQAKYKPAGKLGRINVLIKK
jgi:hypothetical protein